MADSVEVSTSQLVIELVVATAFVVYFALIAGNYRGIMDFFLRQTERNRRFMRRLVGAPVDRTAPLLPPHHELGRKVWKFGFGFLAISGTVFVIVRVVSLVDRLL